MSLLDKLPDIDFAVKDTKIIEQEIIKAFEESTGRILLPADPLRLLILTFAKQISLQRSNIDFSAKQNLLKYAKDDYIEHIGALVGAERLQPTFATTTIKFTLSSTQANVITIPKGTRITTRSKVYFETEEVGEIPIGELETEVKAICTQIGAIGNNFNIGEINQLVDIFPYFESVENTTMSQGGADLEDIERFRERIREAPEGFSTAGPFGAYEFWAKTASQLISDVSVTSPSPGVVQIIPLLENGQPPTDDILDAVYNQCNDQKIRPLTDMVVVKKPEVINYDLKLTYYINRSETTVGLNIQNRVNEAVQSFIDWQKESLGRDINPSRLIKMIIGAGAKRVEIESPTFTKTDSHQVAIAKEVLITYGGLEDD
jgi:phage-related baseplate assembly protein